MGGTQTIISRLASWGHKEGEFIQSTRGGRHLQEGQVDEGFCNGVCVDWIRRVLQQGKVAFSDARAESQTLRQATIQMGVEDRVASKNVTIGLSNELKGIRNAQLVAYNHDNSKDEVTLSTSIEQRLREYYPDLATTSNHRYKISKVKDLYVGLDEYAKREDHTIEVGWAAFAKQMDQYHLRKRSEAQEGASKKPFTHIRILQSANRQHYGDNSARAAVNQLLQVDEFRRRTALLLGFGLEVNGGSTGHAVAVFRPNDLEYVLFDPNYGVFRYESLGDVFSALMYLFGDLGGTGIPIYGAKPGEHVTGAVSYILFAHA